MVSRVFSNWPRGNASSSDAQGERPGPPDAPRKIIQEPREIIQEGREWLETILSRFGPIKERAQTVTTLDFEKPLLELDKRIKEVGWLGRSRKGNSTRRLHPNWRIHNTLQLMVAAARRSARSPMTTGWM